MSVSCPCVLTLLSVCLCSVRQLGAVPGEALGGPCPYQRGTSPQPRVPALIWQLPTVEDVCPQDPAARVMTYHISPWCPLG